MGGVSPAPVGTSADGPKCRSCWSASTLAGRSAITRNGVARYVPVYLARRRGVEPLSDAALATPPPRPADLPAGLSSLRRSRDLVEECLTAWSQTRPDPGCEMVVTAFVENVLHTPTARPRAARNRWLGSHRRGGGRQPSTAQPQRRPRGAPTVHGAQDRRRTVPHVGKCTDTVGQNRVGGDRTARIDSKREYVRFRGPETDRRWTGDRRAFEALLRFMRDSRGFDFTGYKRTSLMRRVRQRMDDVGIGELRRLPRPPGGPSRRVRGAVQHDPDQRHRLLPRPGGLGLLAATRSSRAARRARPRRPIRVWSAGCASGQEAYTGDVLAEALGPEEFRQRVKIYATDVDEDALAAGARRRPTTPRPSSRCPPELRRAVLRARRRPLRRSARTCAAR